MFADIELLKNQKPKRSSKLSGALPKNGELAPRRSEIRIAEQEKLKGAEVSRSGLQR